MQQILSFVASVLSVLCYVHIHGFRGTASVIGRQGAWGGEDPCLVKWEGWGLPS